MSRIDSVVRPSVVPAFLRRPFARCAPAPPLSTGTGRFLQLVPSGCPLYDAVAPSSDLWFGTNWHALSRRSGQSGGQIREIDN